MPEWKGRVPLTRSHCERITYSTHLTTQQYSVDRDAVVALCRWSSYGTIFLFAPLYNCIFVHFPWTTEKEIAWSLETARSSRHRGRAGSASAQITTIYFGLVQLDEKNTYVWFQNRRAKWKKRKKSTNVFRSPGALLPSHGLPPFGGEVCAPGVFADRPWSMPAGLSQLSQGGVSVGGFAPGALGQLGPDLSPALPISSVNNSPYQPHYPLNSLGDTMMSYCNNLGGGGGGGSGSSGGGQQGALDGSPTPPQMAHCPNASPGASGQWLAN
ncbi:Homeobox protein orthopedia [Eumeta japonica]|uniref:Homeobox protein orthopedia n=1 Tax=Eumeta variegata TaxID=151549 RepID=A0A4C1WP22_EUMVA|nr:Homeobox protein orthopedia [Eumeta japonica]